MAWMMFKPHLCFDWYRCWNKLVTGSGFLCYLNHCFFPSFYQFIFFNNIYFYDFCSQIVYSFLELVTCLIFGMDFYPCSGFFSFHYLLYLACNWKNPPDQTENRPARELPKPNVFLGGIGSRNVMIGFIHHDKFRPELVWCSILTTTTTKLNRSGGHLCHLKRRWKCCLRF